MRLCRAHQEIVGWTDNSTPLLIALGYDPVMRFDAVHDTVVEEVQSHLGRPAWRLTASFEYGAPDDTSAFSQQEVYTIDKESGLIVGYRRVSISDGVEDITEGSLSDLQLDATLPAEFPGAFPVEAVVSPSGSPDGFSLMASRKNPAPAGFLLCGVQRTCAGATGVATGFAAASTRRQTRSRLPPRILRISASL